MITRFIGQITVVINAQECQYGDEHCKSSLHCNNELAHAQKYCDAGS